MAGILPESQHLASLFHFFYDNGEPEWIGMIWFCGIFFIYGGLAVAVIGLILSLKFFFDEKRENSIPPVRRSRSISVLGGTVPKKYSHWFWMVTAVISGVHLLVVGFAV
jgi:hypothetical protein